MYDSVDKISKIIEHRRVKVPKAKLKKEWAKEYSEEGEQRKREEI